MTLNFQERLDSISKDRPQLLDGLKAYDIFKEIDQKISELCHKVFHSFFAWSERRANNKTIAELKKIKSHALSNSKLKELYTIVDRWLQGGYDRSYILTDPDAVSAFGEADFRALKLFKNGKNQLSDKNVDLLFNNGKVLFKVQNRWKFFNEIKDLIQFDSENKKFIGWTFVHPDGFIPVDTTDCSSLKPFAKLSSKTHKALTTVANKFWNEKESEVDPNIKKPCILQVMIHNKDYNKPWCFLFKNLKKMSDHHCQIRLIDPKGQVYSFGTWGDKKNLEFVHKKRFPYFNLHTANGTVSFPDREELNRCLLDSVSIPISLKRFEKIKKCAENISKNNGFRFCMSNRNCCRLAQDVLKIAGIDIDCRINFSQYLLACLPDAKDIPIIGPSLATLAKLISFIFLKLKPLSNLAPNSVKKVSRVFGKAILYVPKKIQTFFSSLIFLLLGAGTGNKSVVKEDGTSLEDSNQKRLINSFWDIFNEKPTLIYHSKVLRDWVQKQRSYQLFDNPIAQFKVVNI